MLLAERIEQMFSHELAARGRAFVNYKALTEVLVKDFDIEDFPARLFYNPARVRSVMAKVDAETLANRTCFLCPAGLEEHQLTTAWTAPQGKEYLIRVNPYPIFNQHFTLSYAEHQRQAIAPHYADMLALAKALPTYTLFYNGPTCGASAPDHMHFQAVPMGSLPMQTMCSEGKGQEVLWQNEDIRISLITKYVRGGYLLASDKEEAMQTYFERICSLAPVHTDEWEPRMNLVSWWAAGQYHTLVLLREESRPACFFAEGEEQILISPGAVEMSGIAIVSSIESYERLTAERLRDIILEVSLNQHDTQLLTQAIREL